MNPNETLVNRIKRAGVVKYTKACKNAHDSIDLEALKRKVIEESINELNKLEFSFGAHDSISYTSFSVHSIAFGIINRVELEVFGPLQTMIDNEVECMIDLLYSRPSEDDLNTIMKYIQEGEIECSE